MPAATSAATIQEFTERASVNKDRERSRSPGQRLADDELVEIFDPLAELTHLADGCPVHLHAVARRWRAQLLQGGVECQPSGAKFGSQPVDANCKLTQVA